MSNEQNMRDRYEIAWRIWCWQQGYGKAEDREGLSNWMREDSSRLTEKDIQDREDCLSIADEIMDTGLRLYEGQEWPTRAHDSGYQFYCHDHEVGMRQISLRKIGWLDQKGRVWKEAPFTVGFDGGSLTPLLINPGCD